jgi:hypothetical protein
MKKEAVLKNSTNHPVPSQHRTLRTFDNGLTSARRLIEVCNSIQYIHKSSRPRKPTVALEPSKTHLYLCI